MLINYLPILILLVISTALAAVTVLLGTIIGPRHPTPRKLQPYESGMTPIGPAQRRFPVKFYLVVGRRPGGGICRAGLPGEAHPSGTRWRR